MKEVRWHGSTDPISKPFRTTRDAKLDINCFRFRPAKILLIGNPYRRSAPGVREIRIRQASGAYRIIYLTTIGDVVHVLHAFQKKTQATAKRDIDLAKARLRQIR
jgi:phage-related protein